MSAWRAAAALAIALAGAPRADATDYDPYADTGHAAWAAQRVRPALERDLAAFGAHWGAPVLLRSFKLDNTLELWIGDGARFRLFRTYPICAWSGTLGPKAREGDHQAPEGFYTLGPAQLRERSQYHLGLDLGYPNAYDRAHGYTGDYLLVHGGCVSIGCYAMRNGPIEEIYTLVDAALRAGQPRVEMHAFPFRFDHPPRADWREKSWGTFWAELEPAYVALNRSGFAPEIAVVDGHYVVRPRVAPVAAAPR